jgi:acylphosphatase
MDSRIRIHVFGIVQGVFFRANTFDRATALGISGYVSNLSDGSLEIVAEGEKEKLEELLKWASHGPSEAVVSKLEYSWHDSKKEFKKFKIRS